MTELSSSRVETNDNFLFFFSSLASFLVKQIRPEPKVPNIFVQKIKELYIWCYNIA